MKALRKSLVLLPVALLALTACESKITSEAAKERMNSYSFETVKENYASVRVQVKNTYSNRTGAFKEGGLYANYITAKDIDEVMDDYSDYFCVQETLDAYFIAEATEVTPAEFTYYAYKKTGIKVVGTKTFKNGATDSTYLEINVKLVEYVLDDGRVEKMITDMALKLKGEVTGSIKGHSVATFTWNKVS